MRCSLASIAGLAALSFVGTSSATVLTFDFGGGTGNTVPLNYGPYVGNPAFPIPAGYSYGAAGGLTPNINVLYAPTLKLGSVPPATTTDPTRVFGDLGNVLYRDRAPDFGEPGILSITFAADPGFIACLHGFDIAAVFNSFTGFGEDLPARNIRILDNLGNALFNLDYDANNPDHESTSTTWAPGTNTPLRHKRFTFDPPLMSSRLTLRLDFTQLITIGGNKSDRIGIDNIEFSQVPTPGAAMLLGCSGALLLARRRR